MIPGESDLTTFTGVHTVTMQDLMDGKVIKSGSCNSKRFTRK